MKSYFLHFLFNCSSSLSNYDVFLWKFDVSDLADQTDHDGFTPLLLACETVARDGQNKVNISILHNR